MFLDLNICKEKFSDAYLQAVVSTARLSMTKPSVDDESVDWNIRRRGGEGVSYTSPQLDIQLKCTSRDIFSATHINYPLKIKNYDDLRTTEVLVPRMLIVVVVPEIIDSWLEQSEEQLLMRHCGYWYSLRGMPPVDNSNTVTVNIPRHQLLTPGSLNTLMQRIADGGAP